MSRYAYYRHVQADSDYTAFSEEASKAAVQADRERFLAGLAFTPRQREAALSRTAQARPAQLHVAEFASAKAEAGADKSDTEGESSSGSGETTEASDAGARHRSAAAATGAGEGLTPNLARSR